MLFFSIAILILTMIVILSPKHLCATKKWQCERYKGTINTMKNITTAIKRFNSEKGYFPKNLGILTKPVEKTQIKYLEIIQTDKWANPFRYVVR